MRSNRLRSLRWTQVQADLVTAYFNPVGLSTRNLLLTAMWCGSNTGGPTIAGDTATRLSIDGQVKRPRPRSGRWIMPSVRPSPTILRFSDSVSGSVLRHELEERREAVLRLSTPSAMQLASASPLNTSSTVLAVHWGFKCSSGSA